MLAAGKHVSFYEGQQNKQGKDVVMQEQKQYQPWYFGLLIKVTAASASCKMFPVPCIYCKGNLSGSLSRKTLSEEQNQKAKGLWR